MVHTMEMLVIPFSSCRLGGKHYLVGPQALWEFEYQGAVSSVVEHLTDTEGVTGSNPVSRTIPRHSDAPR